MDRIRSGHAGRAADLLKKRACPEWKEFFKRDGPRKYWEVDDEMSGEVLDDVMIKGACRGKADEIVNCQCNIKDAPKRCDQAEKCMFYAYYKCSKQWKRLA